MLVAINAKHCNACNKDKFLGDFGKDKHSKLGVTDYCRECKNAKARERAKKAGGYKKRNEQSKEYRKAFYSKPENLRKYRDRWYQKSYGLTIQQYEYLLREQDNKCAICHLPAAEEKLKRLAVDHNHKTKKVRGLLCQKCNRAIGLLCENPIILIRAIQYLQRANNEH